MKSSSITGGLFLNPKFIFVCRFILGTVFIYASIDKILNPEAFADIIYNYKVVPVSLINFPAFYMPWLELITGLFIIFEIFPKTAVKLLTAMLIFFILLISFNLIRGVSFDCGCFSTASTMSGSNPYTLLLRDLLLLIPGILTIRYYKTKGRNHES